MKKCKFYGATEILFCKQNEKNNFDKDMAPFKC